MIRSISIPALWEGWFVCWVRCGATFSEDCMFVFFSLCCCSVYRLTRSGGRDVAESLITYRVSVSRCDVCVVFPIGEGLSLIHI